MRISSDICYYQIHNLVHNSLYAWKNNYEIRPNVYSVFIFGNHTTFSNAITNFVFCILVSSPAKTRYYNDE